MHSRRTRAGGGQVVVMTLAAAEARGPPPNARQQPEDYDVMGFPQRDVNEVLERLPMPRPGRASLVCVEGLGGAGKSTLAVAMAEARADICVVHGDDFYGPEETDWRSWSPRDGSQRYFDHRCLERELLQPLRAGLLARFQRYNWPTNTLGEWIDIRPHGIVVVEGVYLLRQWLRPYWDFSIYVDTPRELRQHRLYARGENDEGWIARWAAAEDYYEAAEQPEQAADAIIKGY